ncbi:hypothetical protein [Erwinia mallotivora]|uniref:hypothetical protein n=1 Tax=Erwinia mallotivora TaxID=69222 RepID=UPI0021C0AD39|nr:hypothetical protein [Erwinia mallotivora]
MVRIVKQLPQVIFVCTFVVPATSSPARRKEPGGKKGQQKTEKKGSTCAVNMQFSPADTYEPEKKIQKKNICRLLYGAGTIYSHQTAQAL